MLFYKILACNLTTKMSRPNLFQPMPIKRKPVIRRRINTDVNVTSILGKRKMEEEYGSVMNDSERYGQEIGPNFFETNVGHNLYTSTSYTKEKIKYWREKYGVNC